ncbi:MAG: ATP phosphoribosyltransferase regulatory subunit [Anaerolineaceae bacterium]|nr:MAG: ATP phosphoribosyltransferase regulatory subunit [Anaerolineaceae bacterium]
MKDKLLHTPEGVRDIYNTECAIKLLLQKNLHQVLKLYGFRDIQTPSFEFFDIFNQERGTVASKDMYKLFDKEGNTMVLRPDITPSIARCVAKYYKDLDLPIRLCYVGNTYINSTTYQGKLKEVTQLGAELVNDDSVDADAEMLAITIECLLKAGLKEFQLELGNADFLKSLINDAGFEDEEDIAKLKDLIENKNMFGMEEIIMNKNMTKELEEMFLKLPELFGTLEILEYAKGVTKNPRAIRAISRLEKLYDIMTEYGFEKYISFDLGMLSKYDYYTGIIFRAYTYKTGEAIVTGGRYDNLVGQFGKDCPAIGLAIVIDNLMLALSRQKLLPVIESSDTLIIYTHKYRKVAIGLASYFRKEGNNVILQLAKDNKSIEDYQSYLKSMNIGGLLYIDSNKDIILIDADNGKRQIVSIDEIIQGEI